MRARELSPWIRESSDKFVALEGIEWKGQSLMTGKA